MVVPSTVKAPVWPTAPVAVTPRLPLTVVALGPKVVAGSQYEMTKVTGNHSFIRQLVGIICIFKKGDQIKSIRPQWENMKTVINALKMGVLTAICFLAGCGTPFKYNPKHDQHYPAISNNLGVEIAGGIDQRPDEEKRPEWSRNVEVIVAHALADEIQHAGSFRRVKIHLKGPTKLNKYSYFIEFRVEAFQMFPQSGTAEHMGRMALDAMGWRGALISASIPITWESQVKVEFEVFDAVNKQSILRQSYSESRSLRVNGYQGKSQQIQQTSECLEAVIQRFVGDFSHLAAAQGLPFIR